MMTADEDAPYSLSKSRSSSKTLTRKGTISSIKNKLKKFEDGSCAIRRKLVCVGDGCVGKTSFLTRYSTQEFITDYIPTMYNNFKTPLTKYKINEYRFENYITEVEVDDKLVHLALWDTAGQEEYNRLRPLSYPGTDCILLCFAIDNVDSFKNIESKWMPEITHHCPNIAVILVGLKADLRGRFIKILEFLTYKQLYKTTSHFQEDAYLQVKESNFPILLELKSVL
ncbi:hypothetical protein HK099_005503 [Clydaea vesicula]|uniref:Uncharacterized protein n=1 Tax=Clydaea vesicula TaxID=447962 RepID=A0AAD5UAC3_9FUNG|nr:hypothetical protein HK099_005503 [Clydaea vesicula]